MSSEFWKGSIVGVVVTWAFWLSFTSCEHRAQARPRCAAPVKPQPKPEPIPTPAPLPPVIPVTPVTPVDPTPIIGPTGCSCDPCECCDEAVLLVRHLERRNVELGTALASALEKNTEWAGEIVRLEKNAADDAEIMGLIRRKLETAEAEVESLPLYKSQAKWAVRALAFMVGFPIGFFIMRKLFS